MVKLQRGTRSDFLTWIGARTVFNPLRHRYVGRVVGAVLACFIFLWLLGVAIVSVQFASTLWDVKLDTSRDRLRNLGWVLTGMIGVPFLIWRSVTAWAMARTNHQGLLTERLVKSVEQLGATRPGNYRPTHIGGSSSAIDVPCMEARLSALFSLERIALDSEKDHISVMETLCSYIREYPQVEAPAAEESRNTLYIQTAEMQNFKSANPDMQIAMSIIARRSPMQINIERDQEYKINLRNALIIGIDLEEAKLGRSNFQSANLTNSCFLKAELEDCWLDNAVFDGADLRECSLANASVRSADFSRCTGLIEEQVHEAFGVKKGSWRTRLPPGFDPHPDWFDPGDEPESPELLKRFGSELREFKNKRA